MYSQTYAAIVTAAERHERTAATLAAIDSALPAPVEVFLVGLDDRDVAAALLARHPNLRVLAQPLDRYAARAHAANHSAADVLVFVSADWRPQPGAIASLVAAVADPNVGVAGGLLMADHVVAAGYRFVPARFGPLPVRPEVATTAGDAPQALPIEFLAIRRALFAQCNGFGANGAAGDIVLACTATATGATPRLVTTALADGVPGTRLELAQAGARELATALSSVAGALRPDALDNAFAQPTVERVRRFMTFYESRTTHPFPALDALIADGPHAGAWRDALRAQPHVETIAVAEGDAFAAKAHALTEIRGDRYVVFIDGRVPVDAGALPRAFAELEPFSDAGAVVAGGLTLLAMRAFPQDLRLTGSLDLFLERAVARGIGVRGRFDAAMRETLLSGNRSRRFSGIASIIMLSWNAPQFTKIAVESIRAKTRYPYEMVIVDNGSGEETRAYLRTIEGDADVRIVYNETNLGFAGGCNVGLAAARGDVLVLLNNDVVVTDGWLEDLIGAMEERPLVGMTAPRSNKVAGHQVLVDATYPDLAAMERYASERRRRLRGSGYYTDRVIGFCMAIDRAVIGEIGGIDTRYAIGNFEDDDFCIRVRAAGYKIFVCDDVFIHHFGSASFITNKVDYSASLTGNWRILSTKWKLQPELIDNSYDIVPPIRAGYRREEHFFALPEVTL